MIAVRRFRAMGSDAHLIVMGGPTAIAGRAERRVADLERRWSRFLPDSEVSAVNRNAGTSVRVSAETVELVRLAIAAWRLTGGAFDPTVLGALVRAGYDRSFEQLGSAATNGSSALGPGCTDIEIDAGTVRVPPGTGFDPGGIGKGLAADIVVAEALADGADGICVNLGGDVRVSGRAPAHGAWTVTVEHPASSTPLTAVGLTDGAVATSTTLRRRWAVDGETRHHLIDPSTGRPSDTDLTLASVVAATAWTAEVLAKAVLLRGSEHPFDIVGGTGAEALVVDDTGRVQATDGLTAFLGGTALALSL